ncbi:hypothetical protein HK098_006714, partial [Nowakowskiella sp. JEL0407]
MLDIFFGSPSVDENDTQFTNAIDDNTNNIDIISISSVDDRQSIQFSSPVPYDSQETDTTSSPIHLDSQESIQLDDGNYDQYDSESDDDLFGEVTPKQDKGKKPIRTFEDLAEMEKVDEEKRFANFVEWESKRMKRLTARVKQPAAYHQVPQNHLQSNTVFNEQQQQLNESNLPFDRYSASIHDRHWRRKTTYDVDFFRIELDTIKLQELIPHGFMRLTTVQLCNQNPHIEGSSKNLLTLCTGALTIQIPTNDVCKKNLVKFLQTTRNMTVTAHPKPEIFIKGKIHILLFDMVYGLVRAQIPKVIITEYGTKSLIHASFPLILPEVENAMLRSRPLQIIEPPNLSHKELQHTNYFDIARNFKYPLTHTYIPLFACESNSSVYPVMQALDGVGQFGSIVKYKISRSKLPDWPRYLPLPQVTVYPRIVHRYKSAMTVTSYTTIPKKTKTAITRLYQLQGFHKLLNELIIRDVDENISSIQESGEELNGFRIEIRVYHDTLRLARELLERYELFDPITLFALCTIKLKKVPIQEVLQISDKMKNWLIEDNLRNWNKRGVIDEQTQAKLAQTMNILGIYNWKWLSHLKGVSGYWWEEEVNGWLPDGFNIVDAILDYREQLNCPLSDESFDFENATNADYQRYLKHQNFSSFKNYKQKVKFTSIGRITERLRLRCNICKKSLSVNASEEMMKKYMFNNNLSFANPQFEAYVSKSNKDSIYEDDESSSSLDNLDRTNNRTSETNGRNVSTSDNFTNSVSPISSQTRKRTLPVSKEKNRVQNEPQNKTGTSKTKRFKVISNHKQSDEDE